MRSIKEESDEVLLRYREIDRLTYNEIGAIYGITGCTVAMIYKRRGIKDTGRVRKSLMEELDDESISRMLREGLTHREIAKELSVSKTTISNVVADRGLVRRDKKEEKKEQVRELREAGYSIEKVAEKLNISVSYVNKLIREMKRSPR